MNTFYLEGEDRDDLGQVVGQDLPPFAWGIVAAIALVSSLDIVHRKEAVPLSLIAVELFLMASGAWIARSALRGRYDGRIAHLMALGVGLIGVLAILAILVLGGDRDWGVLLLGIPYLMATLLLWPGWFVMSLVGWAVLTSAAMFWLEPEVFVSFLAGSRAEVGLASVLISAALACLAFGLRFRRMREWLRAMRSERDQASVREQVEDQISRQHALLQAIFKAVPDAVIITDLDFNILIVNPMVTHLLGYSAQELFSCPVSKFQIWENDEIVVAPEPDGEDGGRPPAVVVPCQRKDGTVFFGEALWIPFSDPEGQPLGVMGLLRDLTDSLEKDAAAREADQAKRDFLANMSHEIRTPMNAILGFSELLLQRGLEDDEAVDDIRTIFNSATGLLRLIDDILDFSKADAGRMALESVPFSLARVLAGVEDLFQPAAEKKGLDLNVHRPDPDEDIWIGDPSRLRQVLVNLVGNAIKFTTRGSVDVLAAWKAVDMGSVLRLSVEDTGIGIPPEAKAKLFTPFTQADTSTTRRFGGTGLGLAISKRIIELMGGTIDFESRVGIGTTFVVEVPLERGSSDVSPETESIKPLEIAPEALKALGVDPRPKASPEPMEGPKPDRAPEKRILLADDDPINRLIGEKQLRVLGYEVDTADDGSAVLESVEAGHYDLILMDCQMPILDGYQTTTELRRRLDWHIPIVALTAHAMRGDREKCLDAGMDDYLAKPIQQEELASVLSRWLGLD